jgi:hypothetical protein
MHNYVPKFAYLGAFTFVAGRTVEVVAVLVVIGNGV